MSAGSGNVGRPDRAELAAWLRLLITPGIGRGTARRLLAAWGLPQSVFDASSAAVSGVIGAAGASALRAEPEGLERHLQVTEAWLEGGPLRHIVTLGDPGYPPRLLQSPDPPLLLFVLGDPAHLRKRGIAIVGSRNPSAQGDDNARAFAKALAREGWLIVSGLARGIDAAAHQGALAAGAPTVAVVGTGLDRVYPAAHRELAHRIAATGALVSEFIPGTAPMAENFPQRNRIIAALTEGTLVVEAALRSGSLITARLAAECGREVFAVPGSIHSSQSRGCHALIRDGAKLVETAADILEELGSRPAPAAAELPADPTPSPPEDPVLAAMGHDPASLDAIAARTGWPVSDLLARLLELELAGRVARLPGGLYQQRTIA